MYHVFETKSNPGMGIANIAVGDAQTTNATNPATNNPTPKNSTSTPANHQRSNSSTSATPVTKQPPTPAKPANASKGYPTTPSHIPSNTPSHAPVPNPARNSVSLNAPNRNLQAVDDKAEVNLQFHNKKQPQVQVNTFPLEATNKSSGPKNSKK
jgi:hypothetical protein